MKNYLILFLFFISIDVFTQEILPLNHIEFSHILPYIDTTGTFHTSIKPYTAIDFKKNDSLHILGIPSQSFALKKTQASKSSPINWGLIPLVEMGFNSEIIDKSNTWVYGLGLGQKVNIKKNLSIFANILLTNRYLNESQAQFTDSTKIIKGYDLYTGKTNSYYQYVYYTGGLSWKPARYFHVFAGRDKVFWGDGIRSMLLSADGIPFWQVRASVNSRKIKYVMLYSFLRDNDLYTKPLHYQNKFMSSHYVNINIGKRLQFNFFETVIWRGSDTLGTRGFDVHYINPIIFFRPIEFNLGSPDNVIMGMGGRLRLFKSVHLYGQFILDEFKLSELKAKTGWWANKFGLQAGIKAIITCKNKNVIHLQAEANGARPFMYSHGNGLENYGDHYNPMAHPMGANFMEILARLSWIKGRYIFSYQANSLTWGSDTGSWNSGQNIYRSYSDNRLDYGNTFLQGEKHSQIIHEIKASYLINNYWNMYAEGGFRYLQNKTEIENKSEPLIFITLKTKF